MKNQKMRPLFRATTLSWITLVNHVDEVFSLPLFIYFFFLLLNYKIEILNNNLKRIVPTLLQETFHAVLYYAPFFNALNEW